MNLCALYMISNAPKLAAELFIRAGSFGENIPAGIFKEFYRKEESLIERSVPAFAKVELNLSIIFAGRSSAAKLYGICQQTFKIYKQPFGPCFSACIFLILNCFFIFSQCPVYFCPRLICFLIIWF